MKRVHLGILLMALCMVAGCSASAGTGPASTQGPSTAVARGSRVVSYHGVRVDVPTGWPVVDGMHTLFCGGPFPATPTAFVGPQENGPPGCPAQPDDSTTARNDVWLQAGGPPPDARPVDSPSGQIVLEEDPGWNAPLKAFWYHQVFVEIGIGPDPNVAKAIFNSIGFTSHAPDSRAAGVCARSADPETMPTPERLANPLVLNQGGVTLDPPLPSDQPTMSAAQAWSESGPKQSFERYRLILARYSAKLPAKQNPDGSLTPLNQNELAWVIYTAPYGAPIAGCGGWGVDVFDALSGQEVILHGWSPGP